MRFLSVLPAALCLAACGGAEVQVQKVEPSSQMVNSLKGVAEERLRDPASAQYRNFVAYAIGQGETLVCGELNAKNGFGGYVGFQAIAGFFDSSAALRNYYIDTTSSYGAAASYCGNAASGTLYLSR